MDSNSDSSSSSSGGSTESTRSTLTMIEEALASLDEEEEVETVESKFENELKKHYKSTEEFRDLPPNERKVAVAYSMVTSGRKSDFTCISPDLLLFLLKPNVHEVYLEKEDILSATFGISEDPSSEGIYLMWSSQYLSFIMLKSWFTQKVQRPEEDPKIENITQDSHLNIDDVVIAPTPLSQPDQEQEERQYHRAVVRKMLPERNQVEVQFCDLGAIEVVNISSLFKYDHPLTSLEELPPFSIFARPEGVDMSAYSQDHKPVLFKALAELFRKACRNSVSCKIIQCLPNEPVRVQIKFKNPQLGEQSFEKFWLQYIKWNNPKKRDSVVKAIMESVCTTIKPAKLNIKEVCRHPVKLVHVDRDSDAVYVLNDPFKFAKLDGMQDHYNAQEKCLNRVNKRAIIKRGCAYAWFKTEDKNWYRGVIIEEFTGDRSSLVVLWLVDLGRMVTVSIDELRNLDKTFCFRSCLLRIKLAHVKVLDTVEVQRFLEEEYAAGTVFAALPVKKIILDQDSQDLKVRFVKAAYEMILAEFGNCGDGLGITVQTRLWLANLVKPEGPSVTTFRRNFAQVPQELIKHLRPPCSLKMNNNEVVENVELPPTISRCLSPVSISYEGSGPHDFYLQDHHQLQKLRTMEIYLGTEEMDGSLKKLDTDTSLAIGSVALFLTVKKDHYHGSRRILLRVLIIGLQEKTCTGLAIDYGEAYENMERKYLRQVPEKLREIPPMCQRVHLELPTGYVPAELNGFSYTACLAWLKFIKFWLDLGGTYWAWNLRRNEAPVVLSEMQQKLAFDPQSRQWIPGHLVKYEAYQQVNRLWETSKYSNTYLAPFFNSIGVSLSYHEFVDQGPNQQSMEFPNLVRFLIDRKFVVKG